ncbi:unnamed protein product [Dovyalis caffra]|uniref:Secreted protein n=1 Tax=Dovyalis caffra TaxID=77055 RepID=A0AAV1QRX1_9ROSI|nr:unnamed protein product [Dovyalis caffra]
MLGTSPSLLQRRVCCLGALLVLGGDVHRVTRNGGAAHTKMTSDNDNVPILSNARSLHLRSVSARSVQDSPFSLKLSLSLGQIAVFKLCDEDHT